MRQIQPVPVAAKDEDEVQKRVELDREAQAHLDSIGPEAQAHIDMGKETAPAHSLNFDPAHDANLQGIFERNQR